MAKQTWIVSEDTKERLDKYLSSNTELSRTRVQQLADDGMIFVNGKARDSGPWADCNNTSRSEMESRDQL